MLKATVSPNTIGQWRVCISRLPAANTIINIIAAGSYNTGTNHSEWEMMREFWFFQFDLDRACFAVLIH